jgi:hypothetical protein
MTFKTLLKNLLGRGVPMASLLQESEQLVPLWTAILTDLSTFRNNRYSLLDRNERTYFDLLWTYAHSVRKTVDALVERQRLLNEGSKGGAARKPMTWEGFQEKERVYKAAVEEYRAIGRQLNDSASLVFDD